MKKRTVLIVTLVVLVTLLVSAIPVGAAARNIGLLSAKARYGEAAVFTFKVTGDFGKFSGTAYSGGQAYPLSCALKGADPSVLLCRGSHNLAGKSVQVVVNGFSFDTFVESGAMYCNPVYDVPAAPPDPEWWDYGD